MNQCRTASGYSLIETLVVVALVGVISAIAVPMTGNGLAYFRLSGDARSASNAISLAKMRAASDFSQVRLFVDMSTGTHHLESWNKTTSQWTTEGGSTQLSTNVSFGYGVVPTTPLLTAIAQAPQCKTSAGNDIGNTACVVFNSRGVPVDSTGAPTGVDALYLTDGTTVYGITVSATGMIRSWRTLASATPSWSLQ
jgi:prepilin-type N-terminal cleavage/methylation domain-containing protein